MGCKMGKQGNKVILFALSQCPYWLCDQLNILLRLDTRGSSPRYEALIWHKAGCSSPYSAELKKLKVYLHPDICSELKNVESVPPP
jgi:hypothetical protein